MLVATTPQNRIKAILAMRNMSIQEMARSADVSYTTAYSIATSPHIPNGVRWGTVKKIARVLGVGIHELEKEVED